ncbi:MAG: ribosomal protein S18-alanine N-acetyltransferase [Pseudomonadota bacterium]
MSAVVAPQEARVRPMVEDDVDAVIGIERRSYEFPWTAGIFRDCLRVGYSCWVLDVDGTIAGYAILGVGADEAHILNICIDPDVRRCGHGRRLLARVIDLARWHRAASVFLEVRPTNHAAVNMYAREGFEVVGRRPNYYPAHEGREDALIMVFRLAGETGEGSQG